MRIVWQWISDHLAAIVALLALISSLKNRNKLKALHVDLNSRLTELLRATGSDERAKGVAEGRAMGIKERADRVIESERVEDREDKRK